MEFTLSDLFNLLKRTWWIIVIAAAMGAGVAYTYSAIVAATSYSSQVVIMVDYKSDKAGENWSVQDDLDYSKSIIRNCITILKQNKFYTAVEEYIYEVHEVRYSAATIAGSILYTTDSDTSTFTVTVTTGSADVSFNIADAVKNVILTDGYIAEHYPQFDEQNTEFGTINEVVRAERTDTNSRFFTFMTVGAVGSAAAAFVVLLIIDRVDVRIRDAKLLTKYGYPVLGTVPQNEKKLGGGGKDNV